MRGLHGDGDLNLETDLSVGPASVAIANQSGAFVITADDGVYHRLRLPGFDPSAFTATKRGLALSPDGTRLAYAWHATKPAGSTARPRVGTRILDLRTGALQKIPGAPGYFSRTKVRLSSYGYGWSPNGRYLIFETLTKDPADAGPEHWWVGVDTATARFFMFGHEARDVSCQVATNCPPMTLVGPRRQRSSQNRSRSSRAAPRSRWSSPRVRTDITDLPGRTADWAVGRFTPDGHRILLQPDGVGTGLALVTDDNPRGPPLAGCGRCDSSRPRLSRLARGREDRRPRLGRTGPRPRHGQPGHGTGRLGARRRTGPRRRQFRRRRGNRGTPRSTSRSWVTSSQAIPRAVTASPPTSPPWMRPPGTSRTRPPPTRLTRAATARWPAKTAAMAIRRTWWPSSPQV